MSNITDIKTKHHSSESVLNNFVIRFNNARKAIEQIRNNEWKPSWNSLCNEHCTAHRGEYEIWLANGSWYCEVKRENHKPAFGLIWRHWVWWAAARKLKADADKPMRREMQMPML